MSPVELTVVGNRWETGRIEAFSDGVFAIAITLLVLEIGVPPEAFDDLWSGIVHEWPAYLGFATSFLTIGGIWLAHHGVFRRLRYANDRVMRASSPNVGFFAAAIVLAAVAPRAAAIGYLVIAAASVLRARGDQPAVQPS